MNDKGDSTNDTTEIIKRLANIINNFVQIRLKT